MSEQTQPNGDQLLQTKPVDSDKVHSLVESIGFSFDSEARARDIGNWGVNDLIAATTLLHRELAPEADQNPTDRTMKVSSPAGEDMIVDSKMMSPELRYDLFAHTARRIQEIGRDLKPGQEKGFLDRAANMVGMAVVLAHPFEDGNGRTARTLSYLIKEGYNPGDPVFDDSFELASRNRPEKGFRLTSIIPKDKELSPNLLIDQLAATDIDMADRQGYLERSIAIQDSPLNYKIES